MVVVFIIILSVGINQLDITTVTVTATTAGKRLLSNTYIVLLSTLVALFYSDTFEGVIFESVYVKRSVKIKKLLKSVRMIKKIIS